MNHNEIVVSKHTLSSCLGYPVSPVQSRHEVLSQRGGLLPHAKSPSGWARRCGGNFSVCCCLGAPPSCWESVLGAAVGGANPATWVLGEEAPWLRSEIDRPLGSMCTS